jgi:hypothetical protein
MHFLLALGLIKPQPISPSRFCGSTLRAFFVVAQKLVAHKYRAERKAVLLGKCQACLGVGRTSALVRPP